MAARVQRSGWRHIAVKGSILLAAVLYDELRRTGRDET